MSEFDVHPSEMRRDLFDDRTAEAVLEGRMPPGHELDALAAFVADVRQVYGHGPAPHAGASLARLLASGLTTDKGELPATAVSNAHGPATQVAGLPKWRRKGMVGSRFGTTAAKVAAACAAVGGVAVAGALPSLAQSAVAHAADEVGIELPSPDDRAVPPDATEPPPTSVPASPTAGAPPGARHDDSEHGVPAVDDNEGDGDHQQGDVDDHDADDAEHQGTPTPTTVPEHHEGNAPTDATALSAGHD